MKKHSFDDLPTMTHAQRIAALNDVEIFLPMDYLLSTVVPYIAACCLALCVVFSSTYLFVDQLLPLGADTDMPKRRKVCYQLTNFCANTVLGFAGLYTQMVLQPASIAQVPEQSVQGFDHLIIFSCFQLGYQLWAIPVGTLLVGENPAMLAHHFAVIFVASMSALMTNGFRYWTPFFYGVIELSSIPLAIMNTFKDNPGWIKKHGGLYMLVRLVFCAMFLWIRLGMFIPRQWIFLRDHYLLFSTSTNRPYQVFMVIVFTCAILLQVLQLYWGYLIMKALFRVVQSALSPDKKGSSENGVAVNGRKKIE